ncbi:MAG TPA: GAF domain-containing protein, partial [Gaiellales bacterium]|nr:GAF domain-containing protein [Gaiellales bacterium]
AGIAGWVLVTRQPLVIEDVRADPRFAQDVAEDTGYVPKGIMAVPLLHQERSLGVLEVLDRPANAAFTLAEMDLLGLFANQAAIALDLTQRSRRAREALEGADPAYAAVAHVARRLDELGADSAAVRRLLEALADVLGPASGRRAAGAAPDPARTPHGTMKKGTRPLAGPPSAGVLTCGGGEPRRRARSNPCPRRRRAYGDGDADAPRRPAPSTPSSRRPCPHRPRDDGDELRRRPWTSPRPAPCDGARTPTFGVLLLVGRTRKTVHMTDQRTEIFPQVFTNART